MPLGNDHYHYIIIMLGRLYIDDAWAAYNRRWVVSSAGSGGRLDNPNITNTPGLPSLAPDDVNCTRLTIWRHSFLWLTRLNLKSKEWRYKVTRMQFKRQSSSSAKLEIKRRIKGHGLTVRSSGLAFEGHAYHCNYALLDKKKICNVLWLWGLDLARESIHFSLQITSLWQFNVGNGDFLLEIGHL